jgi:hypothetical protein
VDFTSQVEPSLDIKTLSAGKIPRQHPRMNVWKAVEASLGSPLPKAYKTFIDPVGGKSYRDVDGEEGFVVNYRSGSVRYRYLPRALD